MQPSRSLLYTCALSAVLLTGTSPLAQEATHYLTLRVPGGAYSLQVTNDSLLAPDVQLTLHGDQVRGRAFGQAVRLTVKPGEVSGTVDGEPTRLVLSREGDTRVVSGLLSRRVSRLRLSPEQVSGSVGDCSYDLKLEDGWYQGARACGSGLPERPVSLSVPAELLSRSEVLTVLGLTLLLGD